MRKLSFSYQMELAFSKPILQHDFTLRAFPMMLPEQQICSFQWELQPAGSLQFHQDYFGNRVGAGRIAELHDKFRFAMSGIAWLDLTKKRPEPCLPLYRYRSEYCAMTPQMESFLRELAIPKTMAPLQQAALLMEGLKDRFQYQSGTTTVTTTAGQAFAQGYGVCQDYAHIFITMSRYLGIPARYVAGIIDGQGETHAWVELYDNGMWHGVDPTQNCMVTEGYLKLTQGRDYLDGRLNRGVFQGMAKQTQTVSVRLEESE